MSAAPLTFLEKKWASGYGNNNLYPTATQTNDRKRIPNLDNDIHRNISAMGRRTLLTLGRRLYCNPVVSGAIDEMVTYAASVFISQFEGGDKEWGTEAENFIYEHDKICDIAGEPYNMALYRRLLLSSLIVDGELATLYTEFETGLPALQTIPSHRIRSRNGDGIIKVGEYDGARIIDGCVLNDYGRVLAYDVAGENPSDLSAYRYISTRDMKLSFLPKYPGQLRGWSTLGESAFDWQDVEETRLFEKLSQKLGASFGFIEKNEEGEVDQTKKVLARRSTDAASTINTDGTAAYLRDEVVNGVTMRYFKAGKGHGLESVKNDRPTMNQQAFEDRIIRGAFKGMNWDVDFSLDPSKVGGASMRVVIEKVNRQIAKLQDLVLEPAVRRFDGYRVAKVMENPERTDKKVILLPFNAEWHKWTYQTGARLTADAKYDSEIDQQEVGIGLKTRKRALANRGEYIEDVDNAIEADADMKWQMAGRIAKAHGIDITAAYNSLWTPTPNGIAPAKEEKPAPNQAKEGIEE